MVIIAEEQMNVWLGGEPVVTLQAEPEQFNVWLGGEPVLSLGYTPTRLYARLVR